MKPMHALAALLFCTAASIGLTAQDRAAPEPATVVLLDAGVDDRSVLRWKPEVGVRSRMKMTMDMSMSLVYDGAPMPPSSLPTYAFDMTIEAEEPGEDGIYPVRTVYERVTLEGEGDAMTRAALLKALEPLEGTEIRFAIDSRGVLQSLDISGVPPQILQMLGGEQGARRMIESFGNPLPEEAVGVGATWEVVQTVRTPNAPALESRTVYELVSREGDRIELRLTGTQTGKEQEFETGVAGLQATLQDATGSFQGSAVLRLDRLAPVRASNEGKMEFHFTFTERGIRQRMEQTVEVRVDVRESDPD